MFSGQLTTPDRFSYHTGTQICAEVIESYNYWSGDFDQMNLLRKQIYRMKNQQTGNPV